MGFFYWNEDTSSFIVFLGYFTVDSVVLYRELLFVTLSPPFIPILIHISRP